MTNVAATSAPAPRAVHATAQAAVAAATAAVPASAGSRAVDTAFLGGPRKAGSPSVKERFSTLEQRFLPDKAKGVNVKLQFKLSGADGGQWYIVIKDGKIKVTEGTGPGADATVIAKASDYQKMADGEMNKTIAFLRGKLKIEGDRKYLDDWETWFKPA